MTKNKLAHNVFYNMLYQTIATVLPIITTPYIARTLGLSANGIHTFCESIATYFIVIANLGSSLYGIKKIAQVREEPETLSKTALEIIVMRLMLTVLTLAVYIPVFCIKGPYALIFTIQAINILASGIDISWIFQGLEDFKKVTIRNLTVKLVFLVLVFTLIKSPEDLPLYVLITVLSVLSGTALMYFYLPKYIKVKGRLKPRAFCHLKGSLVLFAPQAMNYIYSLLDRSMLGIIRNTDMVSIYDMAQRIIRMITALLQSVGFVMMAKVSNLTVSDDTDSIKRYIRKSLNFNLFFAFPATLGIIAVADDLVPVFLGDEFLSAAPLLKLLSVLIFTMSINSLLGYQLLIPLGFEKKYTVATAAGAAVNLILNLFILKPFGFYGAAISSVAAEVVVFVISFKCVKNYFDLKQIFKDNILVFPVSLLMFAVIFALSFLPVSSVIRLIIQLSAGLTIYLSVMYFSKNETLLAVLDFAKGFIKK